MPLPSPRLNALAFPSTLCAWWLLTPTSTPHPQRRLKTPKPYSQPQALQPLRLLRLPPSLPNPAARGANAVSLGQPCQPSLSPFPALRRRLTTPAGAPCQCGRGLGAARLTRGAGVVACAGRAGIPGGAPMSSYNRGKWAAFQVFIPAPYQQPILRWIEASGLPRAAFLRAALLRGSLALARDLGLPDAASFPLPSPDQPPHTAA
jgi:hypothetical protein